MTKNSTFEHVKPVRLYRRIVDQIEGALVRGDLKPGQRLPSERELVEQFGASRSTVREALRVLESDGVVRSRPGDPNGPELLPFSTGALARQMTRLVRFERIGLAELISSRMIFDSSAARLAALLHTPEELAAIEGAIEAMAAALPADYDNFTRSDLAFHQAVAKASRNTFLQVSHDVVRDVVLSLIADDIAHSDDKTGYMVDSLEVHRQILDAIRRRDGATASRISRRIMFDYYVSHVPVAERAVLEALLED